MHNLTLHSCGCVGLAGFREGLRILSFTWKSLLSPPPAPGLEFGLRFGDKG